VTLPLPLPLPDPSLAQGDLRLRPWRLTEATALVRAWHDPEVARWTGVPPAPVLAEAQRWIAGDADRRARGLSLDLVIDVDGEVAGEVGLVAFDPAGRTAEIGWWVAPAHRGCHVATTAAALVAAWAIEELCIDAVQARCARANPASGGVARAAGFALTEAAGDAELWTFAEPRGATLGV
jgi:RimJ/RimL family protein N-acetyltransferase